jgi:hypothetical protein
MSHAAYTPKNWETTMFPKTIHAMTRALGLAIAMSGLGSASVRAQQVPTGLPPDTATTSRKSASLSPGRARGLVGRAAAAAASAAKSVKQSEAKQDVAQAALVAVAKANPGPVMLQEVLRMQERDHARAAAAQAARQAQANAAMATATAQMSAGMAAIAQQVQSTSRPSIAAPSGPVESDSAMTAARAEYTRLAARAASGDRRAAQQLERFQREMSAAAPTLSALPASEQQAAYDAALRNALACATSGKACRTR